LAIKLVNAGSIKPGSYIIIDGVACKASDISTSKPGKHGSAKARIVAMSLIGNKRKELVTGTGDNVEVPIIEKKTAQILSITGDKANVMDMESYETFDMEIPEDLKGQVAEGVQVLYWIILEDKVMKQIKG